jgi:hypothetical protein
MEKKKFLIAFFASWAMMMLSCLLSAPGKNEVGRTFTDSICFYVMVTLLLRQYATDGKSIWQITAVAVAGFLVLMTPLYPDFAHAYFAQADIAVILTAMVLAAVNFKTRRLSVFLLSLVVMILLNSYCVHAWIQFVKPSSL